VLHWQASFFHKAERGVRGMAMGALEGGGGGRGNEEGRMEML